MSVPSGEKNNIWWDLNKKFSKNLELALSTEVALTSRAEIQARAIPAVAGILGADPGLTIWQRDALCMFDEVFADLTCSIYLSACGLDKPAQTILRRALEVGIATVYVWDLPHAFWAWKEHDKDLNFNDMLEHLSSTGFTSHAKRQNPKYSGTELFNMALAKTLYRQLSNIVHGKMASFESVLPDKFQHSQPDWRGHLELVCAVEDILNQLWINRFLSVSERLESKFPQLRMRGTSENEPQS
jgi:hypothetical protein